MNEKPRPALDDIEMLAEVSDLLTVMDLDRVLQQVIALARRTTDADEVSLFLHESHDDERIDWEHLITMRDLTDDESVQVVSRVLDEGFAGWVTAHKRGDIITDTSSDERWLTFPDDPVTSASALCVPFLYDDEVIATMTLVHEAPQHFTPYHLRLLTIMTNQAAIAIRNAQLFSNLNAQRRHFEAILYSITDALLVLHDDGRLMHVNERALELMALEDEADAIDKPLREFSMVDAVFEPLVEVVDAALPNTERRQFMVRSERRQADYTITMAEWKNPERDASGYVIVMHDVTELKDLSRFKDEIIDVAGSDISRSLALISGYADAISMDIADDDSPVHDYVDIITRTVKKIRHQLDALLRVERLRQSSLDMQDNVDPEAMVKVVLVNMRPFAKSKAIAFDADVQLDEAPRLRADPMRLREAMQQLIANAIRYTPHNGSVRVQAHCDNHKFHFSVEDNGIGIPDEHQRYVFEPFYRVDNATSDDGDTRMGTGLSLVKYVVLEHGGEVWVRSTYGEGSRFGFWVPLPTADDAT